MAILRELPAGRSVILEPEHWVGRGSESALGIAESYVSTRHAVLRWIDGHWVVRDLGSRNGTFVDGQRLAPGEHREIRKAATLDFGGRGKLWELIDDSAPPVMIVPLHSGVPLLLEGDLLSLPSSNDPRVTIYRGKHGWIIEQPDSVSSIANGQRFEVDKEVWRFCCPENVRITDLASEPNELSIRVLTLAFSVSSDEEHVQLRIVAGQRVFDLGARNHNYLLLTLARQRLADELNGELEPRCGWMYQDEVLRDPNLSPQHINLDVFRIRQQFAAAGVHDAACIVERRPKTKQIRIAKCAISIDRV